MTQSSERDVGVKGAPVRREPEVGRRQLNAGGERTQALGPRIGNADPQNACLIHLWKRAGTAHLIVKAGSAFQGGLYTVTDRRHRLRSRPTDELERQVKVGRWHPLHPDPDLVGFRDVTH